MKKLFVMIFMFFVFPLVVLAGNAMPQLPGTFTPADYFVDFLTWIATVVFLTSVFNRLPFLQLENQPKRYFSWVIMVITGLLAYIFEWGIFDTTWYYGLVYIVAGAVGSHVGYHAVKEFLKDVGVLK